MDLIASFSRSAETARDYGCPVMEESYLLMHYSGLFVLGALQSLGVFLFSYVYI